MRVAAGPREVRLTLWIFTLVYVIALVFFYIYRVRKFRSKLETVPMPARIRLVPNEAAAWRDPRALRRAVDALEILGFDDAGTFEIEGLPKHRMKGMVKPSEAIVAQIYEAPGLGLFLLLFSRYRDGTRLSYSNLRRPVVAADRPGYDEVRLKGLDPTHLYLRFVNERRQGPMRPLSASEFAREVESQYEDKVAWLAARGGFSYDELRSIRLRFGMRMAPRFARLAARVGSRRWSGLLDTILRDRFAEAHGLSADGRDRLVIVHDRMTLDEAADLLAREAGADAAEARSNPLHAAPRASFAARNERLSESRRLVLLGTLDEPVAADVYGPPGTATPADVAEDFEELPRGS